MRGDFYKQLTSNLETARAEGLFKEERIITSAQQADITVGDSHVINFCANNYLGLANHPELIAAAKSGMDSHGFGMASVRFICGTQDTHKQLEKKLADFLGMEDAILYSSCFDANGGLFETLLGPEDAIISDALNHASIIDGVRLCKAKRFRYANNDMQELEARLKEAREAGARHVLIATDGVFSMDGVIANLQGVCDLADKYDALVMVDDSHAVGFVGENGRGSHEYCDVMGRVDIITGTLGKALGGASGGYTAARKEVVEWLRQRSRPYLFSNSLAPAIVAASIKVLEMVEEGQTCAIACGLTRVCSAKKNDRGRLHAGRRRPRHHSGDAGRGGGGAELCPRAAERRDLCHRLLLSGGTERPGAYSHPDVGGAYP